MVLSSSAIISRDNVDSNFITIMVDSGASSHYFDDAIIRDLKYRLQNYVRLITPRKILTAGGTMLDVAAEGVPQGLVTNDYGNQSISWWCPGLGITFSR